MFLKDRTAAITGSTSGIGLAYARALAKEGANLVINGIMPPADAEKLRSDLEAEFGVKAVFSPADMTKPAEIAGFIAEGEKAFGAVDILINNAGIQYVAPIDEFPLDKWDQIIAINLSSAFHTIRAALPKMKEKGWGRIINTASAHALVASPFKSAYVAAKHGIAGLTKTVALEVATKGITVNAIAPGYIDTDMVAAVPADVLEKIVARIPVKRLGQAHEIARGVLFLVADDAGFITGSTISINGGQHMY